MSKVINPLVSNWKNQEDNILYKTGTNQNANGKTKQLKGNSIYAGNLNMQQDKIAAKKVNAQKQAMKAILDKFSIEQQKDDNLKSHQENVEALRAKSMSGREEVEKIEKIEQDLKDSYHIDDNSEEQKDLELLKKGKNDTFKNSLTKEESQRLENMGELTDYQKEALHYDDIKQEWKDRVKEADNQVENENRTIEEIKVSRLKSAPMIDAREEADTILEAASKEVIGMLIDEAKEHINDKMEEDKEKIEEEKKQEEEKKTEDNNNTNTEEVDQLQQIDANKDELERKLKDIMQQLPQEDIMGIVINQQV